MERFGRLAPGGNRRHPIEMSQQGKHRIYSRNNINNNSINNTIYVDANIITARIFLVRLRIVKLTAQNN